MCNVFKDGLAEFVRSFAVNQGKESSENPHQVEEDVQIISKKRRRTRQKVTEARNEEEVLLDHMEVPQKCRLFQKWGLLQSLRKESQMTELLLLHGLRRRR
jgi:hypothetical protein